MRKMFLATASAAALTLSVSAFAQDTGTTNVLPAPTVGNDQAGQTPDITNDRGQTQPSGSSTLNSTTGEVTGAAEGGSVGVTPDISNDRGQTQPSGSSQLNSTTGAIAATDCEDAVVTQKSKAQTSSDC